MSRRSLNSLFFTPRKLCRMSLDDLRLYGALSRLNWTLIAAFCLAAGVTVSVTRLRLSGNLIPLPLVVIVGSGLLSLFYTYVRRDAFVAVLSNTIALAAAANFAAGLLSYTTQFWGASIPLRDANFAEFDSVLGFDWVAWFSWLNARPLLATILRAAYVSLPFQILFLSIAQFVFSWELRVQRLFLATLLAGIMTFTVAAIIPAIGAYPYLYGHINAVGARFLPLEADYYVSDIMKLRGPSPTIPLADYQGIITFPSFHTVLGVLFIWVSWPSRGMRTAAILVNGLMILSTPSVGGHYVVDVIAGAGVAFVGIWATSYISRQIAYSQQGSESSTPRFAQAGLTKAFSAFRHKNRDRFRPPAACFRPFPIPRD
jgi:PAP2 superfamily